MWSVMLWAGRAQSGGLISSRNSGLIKIVQLVRSVSFYIFFPTFFTKATFHILTAGGDQVLQVRGGWYSTLPWALRSARDQHWCGILLLSLLAKTFTVQLIPKLRRLPSRCSSRGPHCGLLISPYPGWHPESRCFCLSWLRLFPVDGVNDNCPAGSHQCNATLH